MSRIARSARLLLALALLCAGCTWVQLTHEGEGVRVGTAADVGGCEKLGATHATTADKVWIFARSDRKVKEELEDLARNEAAEMGANVIVPRAPDSGGHQSFDVYRCGGG